MKVYSLYHNETYVASFPNKESARDIIVEKYPNRKVIAVIRK